MSTGGVMQHSATQPSDSATAVAYEQSWAALLLAWVAAFSDAIGFLVLQQLGASFMSGNSMATGAALGRLDWASVLQRGVPILAFFLGNMLGFLVLAVVRRWGIRSSFAVVFGLEAVCMLAFLLLGTHALQGGVIRPSPSGIFYLCVVLLTLAMGLQTATVRRAGGQGVRTTFVTVVLSEWAPARGACASARWSSPSASSPYCLFWRCCVFLRGEQRRRFSERSRSGGGSPMKRKKGWFPRRRA